MKKIDNRFIIIENENEFRDKVKEQKKDDVELAELLNGLAKEDMHKQFNFALLNLGTLLQTISIFFDLKEDEFKKILELKKEQVQQRKITLIVNEINEKILRKSLFTRIILI